MPEFFQTPMGRHFYEDTMPRIATSLEKIAETLDRPRLSEQEVTALAEEAVDNMGDIFYDADSFHDAETTNDAIRTRAIVCVVEAINKALRNSV